MGKISVSVDGHFIEQPFQGVDLDIPSHKWDLQVGECMPREVVYVVTENATDTAIPLHGEQGTGQTGGGSLVVLDVGRWGGGGLGAVDGNWAVQRDFGVVYGSHVCLCTFDKCLKAIQEDIGKLKTSKPPALKDERDDCIKDPVLAKLFTALDAAGMGKVYVRRHLIADGKQYDSACAYVLVGDMHIGVVKTLEQAKKNGRRYGRVTVKPLEILAKGALPTDTRSADAWPTVKKALADVAAFATNPSPSGTNPGSVIDAYNASKASVANDTMTDDEVEAWFNYYHTARPDGKPADIFEDAGADFKSFMAALSTADLGTYDIAVPGSSVTQKQAIQKQLVQMGDMFDLWVGFTCHFTPSTSGNYGTVTPGIDPKSTGFDEHNSTISGVGKEMLTVWGDGIMTTQPDLAAGVATARAMKPEAVFLYGNHDNYFGAHALNGPGTFPRQAFFDNGNGMYCEHGHQWPDKSANADDKETIDQARYMLGTPAPLGEMVTQFAFIRPVAVRALEGFAGAVISMDDPYGQRLQQTGAAADMYLRKKAGFGIYVLAHTHVGNLTKVRIQYPRKLDPETRAKDWDQTNKVTLQVVPAGAATGFTKDIGPRDRDCDYFGEGSADGVGMDVTLKWTNMCPDNKAWVTLVDPQKPDDFFDDYWCYIDRGDADQIAKEHQASTQGTNGEVTFKNVVPGVYEARAYSWTAPGGPSAQRPCVRKKFAIVGISTASEVNADGGGKKFVATSRKENIKTLDVYVVPPLPTYLRWAGMPQKKKSWVGFVSPKQTEYQEGGGSYVLTGTSSGIRAVSTDPSNYELPDLPDKVNIVPLQAFGAGGEDGATKKDWGPMVYGCIASLPQKAKPPK